MNEPNENPDTKTVEEIYQDALKLSPEEREKLSCMLEHDLHDPDSWYATPEIAQAWNEEIARRVKLMAEGKMATVDGETVMRRLRKIVAE